MTALADQSDTDDTKHDRTVVPGDLRADPTMAAEALAEGMTVVEIALTERPTDATYEGVSVEPQPDEPPAIDSDAAAINDVLMVELRREDDVVTGEAVSIVQQEITSVEIHAGAPWVEPHPETVAADDIAQADPQITTGDAFSVTLVPSASDDATDLVAKLGRAARAAAAQLALAPSEQKNRALREAARALRTRQDQILAANARDLDAASDLTPALRDRLLLNADRIEAMARGLVTVAGLPDPVGTVLADWTRPNGLHIQRVRVPLGVIGIIYESRPNVTADAGALCLKAGNAAILRGGSESFHSSSAIAACLTEGLVAAGLPAAAIQLVPTTDRAAVGAMLASPAWIDVIVPRGGRSLIERVQRESRVPVFAHLEGINHVYVDAAADLDMTRAIAMNAKMRRVSVCGAMETLLVDRAVVGTHLQPVLNDLLDAGCEVRGDATVTAADPRVRAASEQDWSTEYLEAILSVRVVDGIDQAIEHINNYGSHHTDAIVTEDESAAAEFLARIDSGIVLVNASTQFADGAEFGMGAEIGISTGKLHARGPVGAEQLTSYKYLVRGTGQVRP